MKNFNPNEINGSEIIDFLNEFLEKDRDDCSLNPPLVFESQKTSDGAYRMYFSAHYNNWGTLQVIEGNGIVIDGKGVIANLEEPFCDDGSYDVLEKCLTEWLETHEFMSGHEVEVKFDGLLGKAKGELEDMYYGNSNKLQQVIDWLVEAKTLMK